MRIPSGCALVFAWLCQAAAPLAATVAGLAVERPGGPPVIARAVAAPVRLVSPASNTVLVGGTEAWLAWEPLGPAAPSGSVGRPGAFEEWEAFLSLDGGRHYTLRITPHLGRDLQRFAWSVPSISSADARLLLRFGDERRERAWQVDRRFRIVTGAAGELMPGGLGLTTGELLPAALALAPGEAPLPGEAGVVSWVEGTRRGGARRQVAYGPPGLSGLDLPEFCFAASLAATETTLAPFGAPRRHTADIEPAPAAQPPAAARWGAPNQPIELLLMTRRRNE
jgi:hypothetical protein